MDNSDPIAINVEHLSKSFRLPHEKTGSIKNVFVNAVQQVRKRRTYETQRALKDITFRVKEGEFFGIVGRNGSGKSTLLKIMASIYQPTKGSIQVAGKLVPFIELGVGFSPELTGRENVYLNGALLGFSKKEIDAQYDDIVSFAELKPFMDQKLKNYSSGMQVRLAFSMAVRAKADILLIDEVLAVGDAAFQRKCFDYFRTLKRDKKTVVFVSHNMDAVREYCDRAALIEDSHLVSIGSSQAIAAQYTKLFTAKPDETSQKASQSKRWGEASGIIQKVHVPAKLTKDSQPIEIKVELRPNMELERPIIGYIVKDATGTGLSGANTKTLRVETEQYAAQQPFTVTFTMDNVFSDGKYDVDVAVIDRDGITVLDWWDAAAQFSVFEESPSPYPLSPTVTVDIKKS